MPENDLFGNVLRESLNARRTHRNETLSRGLIFPKRLSNVLSCQQLKSDFGRTLDVELASIRDEGCAGTNDPVSGSSMLRAQGLSIRPNSPTELAHTDCERHTDSRSELKHSLLGNLSPNVLAVL